MENYVKINRNTWVLRNGRTDDEITCDVKRKYNGIMSCDIKKMSIKPSRFAPTNPITANEKTVIFHRMRAAKKSGESFRKSINLTIELAAEIVTNIAHSARAYKQIVDDCHASKPVCGEFVDHRRTEWGDLINRCVKQFGITHAEIGVL